MILTDAIVFLIILALLLKRDLSLIARLPYRGGWSVIIGVIALFILQATLIIYTSGQAVWQAALLIGAQLALVFLLLLNRHVPGIKLFVLGIILNTAVMVANGGWMPVTPEIYQFVHPGRPVELYSKPPSSKNIILPYNQTNLRLLSDIIPVTLPWRRNAVSGGDLCLVLGAAQFIFQINFKKKRGEEIVKLKGAVS
ncbi:MAG: DUF5317 domain-containing protein [Anaerolineae bacterium]|nr:DUF5317 domain-containing protein [Anaerolineae bacterium]